jgi:hypothetical protein
MKSKLTLAAAVTSILLAGGAAHAAAIVPNSGDGSLLFFVTDTKTNQTYTDVLTQTVNGYFSVAQATTPATNGIVNILNGDTNFSVNLSGDSVLTSFLTSAGSDPLSYGIIGGAYSGALGAGQRPQGKVRMVASSPVENSVLTNLQSQLVNATPSGLNVDVQTLNINLGAANSTNQGVFGTPISAGGPVLNLYGGGLDQTGLTGVVPGTAVTLYGVTGNGIAGASTTAFSLGTLNFSLANDTLTFTGNGGTAPVPLPAAVWLLGSGLLGLAGVGRRRAVKVA